MAVQLSAGTQQVAGGGERDTHSVEALRDTLTLINELSDALVGQVQRARRQFTNQPALGIGRSDLDSLEKQALRLRHKSLALSPTPLELVEPDGEAKASSGSPAAAGEPSEDAARTLAIELKLAGRPLEEAERLLRDFGFENATALVADAWGSQQPTS